MPDPLKNIHLELWEKSQKEEPFRELEARDIEDTIHGLQGYDNRTVNKYWRLLREKGLIEEVPRLGRYKIREPERDSIEPSGETATVHISIDKSLRESAESLGLNFSSILNEAVAEKVASRREYISNMLGQSTSEEEAEFIFDLIQTGLYKKRTDPELEGKIDSQRRELYKDVFGVDQISQDQYDHLEELRLNAWDVAEAIGVRDAA